MLPSGIIQLRFTQSSSRIKSRVLRKVNQTLTRDLMNYVSLSYGLYGSLGVEMSPK